MKTVILDGETLGFDVDLSPITEANETTIYQSTSPDLVAERIEKAEVVVINKIKLNESNLKNAKNLKLICLAATGYDNVDISYCKERGIAVFNVVGYSTDSVAQITVNMALNLVNSLNAYTNFVKDGSYTKSGKANCLVPVYHELSALTWGVAGLGNIGRKTAEIAKAFGCRVLAFKRTPDTEFETVSLDELCEKSDIISIHLPHNEKTDRIFSRKMISKMKKGVIIVNTARGKVIDEEAILEGIKNKTIGGFGTDVYPIEPFPENSIYNELKEFDNVCMTPHMAWGGIETRNRCVFLIAQNIKDFESGKESKNRVV